MRKRLTVAGIAGALSAFLIIGAAFAATTVTNGSFESGLTGWNNPAAVDVVCGGWQASDGNCSVDMGGSPSQGKLTQDLSTVAGATYTVSFALAGNPSCTPGNSNWVGWVSESGAKTLVVSATGAASSTYSFDVTGKDYSNMGWTPQTYSFTATGALTTLSFENGVSQWCGTAIDAVSVSGGPTAVTPTSADQCKKGGWQTLTDHLGNKFKNQGDCVSYVATAGKNLGAIAP